MFRKQKNDSDLLTDYTVLLGGLAITGLLIRAFRLAHESLLFATIPLSIGYIIWGVVHHRRHGHIDRKIFLEYTGLAVLVNVIIFSLVA